MRDNAFQLELFKWRALIGCEYILKLLWHVVAPIVSDLSPSLWPYRRTAALARMRECALTHACAILLLHMCPDISSGPKELRLKCDTYQCHCSAYPQIAQIDEVHTPQCVRILEFATSCESEHQPT
jgi:hypothetical protein